MDFNKYMIGLFVVLSLALSFFIGMKTTENTIQTEIDNFNTELSIKANEINALNFELMLKANQLFDLNNDINELKSINNTVIVEHDVFIDNGKLALLLDFMENHKTMRFNEIVSDDFEVLEAIEFYNDIEEVSKSYIEDNFMLILDEENKLDTDLDDFRKSEISLNKIEDVLVTSVDFEDKDATVTVEFKVKGKESGESSQYFTYTAEFDIIENIIDSVELI